MEVLWISGIQFLWQRFVSRICAHLSLQFTSKQLERLAKKAEKESEKEQAKVKKVSWYYSCMLVLHLSSHLEPCVLLHKFKMCQCQCLLWRWRDGCWSWLLAFWHVAVHFCLCVLDTSQNTDLEVWRSFYFGPVINF